MADDLPSQTVSQSSITPHVASSAASTAMTFYISIMGIAPVIAAGLVAVLDAGESNLNPLAENNSGTETGGAINPKGSFGIEQLNGIRQQRLLDYCTRKGGLDYRLLTTQLAFTITEIADYFSTTVWPLIQGNPASTTTTKMVSAMVRYYESPANPDAEIARSQPEADALAAQFANVQPTPVPTPTPTPITLPPLTPDQIVSIISLLRQFPLSPSQETALANILLKLLGV